jgi:PIN domain nuclease of toxin-antitoxin system
VREIAVTDTHALVWYALGRTAKLGPRARAFFGLVDEGRAAAYVPTLALVELLEADHRGILSLAGGGVTWLRAMLASGSFFEAPLTADIVVRANGLYAIPERGDRLIAATAAHMDLPLITRDPEIRNVAGVEVLW